MKEFVQAYDPVDEVYRKIHVRTGAFVGMSHQRYPDLEEVEPLEDNRPKPMQGYADPLEMMR